MMPTELAPLLGTVPEGSHLSVQLIGYIKLSSVALCLLFQQSSQSRSPFRHSCLILRSETWKLVCVGLLLDRQARLYITINKGI